MSEFSWNPGPLVAESTDPPSFTLYTVWSTTHTHIHSCDSCSRMHALCQALCWHQDRQMSTPALPSSSGFSGAAFRKNVMAWSPAVPPAQMLTLLLFLSLLSPACSHAVSSDGTFFLLLSVANSGSSLTSHIAGIFPSHPSPAPDPQAHLNSCSCCRLPTHPLISLTARITQIAGRISPSLLSLSWSPQ